MSCVLNSNRRFVGSLAVLYNSSAARIRSAPPIGPGPQLSVRPSDSCCWVVATTQQQHSSHHPPHSHTAGSRLAPCPRRRPPCTPCSRVYFGQNKLPRPRKAKVRAVGVASFIWFSTCALRQQETQLLFFQSVQLADIRFVVASYLFSRLVEHSAFFHGHTKAKPHRHIYTPNTIAHIRTHIHTVPVEPHKTNQRFRGALDQAARFRTLSSVRIFICTHQCPREATDCKPTRPWPPAGIRLFCVCLSLCVYLHSQSFRLRDLCVCARQSEFVCALCVSCLRVCVCACFAIVGASCGRTRTTSSSVCGVTQRR